MASVGFEKKDAGVDNTGFNYTHTMLRVKDAKKSLHFYCNILGMTIIRENHFPDNKFSLYFLAYVDEKDIPTEAKGASEQEIRGWSLSLKGVIELTHNHGTEDDENFSYHNGNVEPRGYGHIALTVPDLNKTCDQMTKAGVEFKKRPEDGRMRSIAFIYDPDKYWVELIQQGAV